VTDMEIPPAAIEAVWAAREAHGAAPDPTGLRCRCGRRAPSGVDQLRHETRALLAAALPHLLTEVVVHHHDIEKHAERAC
jgi:hypothetical protein